MVRVSFLRPIDQFNGTRRLLNELRDCLHNDEYDHLLLSVAFAKSGPLLRLAPDISVWRQHGKNISAIFGIDLLSTSKQALDFALNNFNDIFITHTTAHVNFHPKFYLFYGADHAVCFQGSHNLTVGGTEINFEGGTKIEMDRPEDEETFQEALSCWESLLPTNCSMTLEVDRGLITNLLNRGDIFDETVNKPRRLRTVGVTPGSGTTAGTTASPSPFPRTYPKPQSSIPREVLLAAAPTAASAKGAAKAGAKKGVKRAAAPPVITSEALVIQIVPQNNGEVYLSKRAVDQNPTFFGFPFTGRAKPKKSKNPPYPQRVPDPVVNVTIYDEHDDLSLAVTGFNLNTVFYEGRSEIRITFSTELRKATAPYSIMVMRQTEEAHDYDIEIFNPGSALYQAYLDVCNQTLPGGGSAQPRRMGWL